jgi:hypothetical protein
MMTLDKPMASFSRSMASDAKLGGASTTESLVVALRTHIPDASPRDRGRIRSWIALVEGHAGDGGIGRPMIDDADAIGRIAERMAHGISRHAAILSEARWLAASGDERASLESIRHRLGKKLGKTPT